MPDPTEPDRASIEQGMLELAAFFAELKNQANAGAADRDTVSADGPGALAAEGALVDAPQPPTWCPGLLEITGAQLPQEERVVLLQAVEAVVGRVDATVGGIAGEVNAPGAGGLTVPGDLPACEPAEGACPRDDQPGCRGAVEAVAFQMVEGA